MMSKYYLNDVLDSATTLRKKIKVIEAEMNGLVKEQFKLMKSYAEVERKLRIMCNHDWEKLQNYQFSPIVCLNCGIEKR